MSERAVNWPNACTCVTSLQSYLLPCLCKSMHILRLTDLLKYLAVDHFLMNSFLRFAILNLTRTHISSFYKNKVCLEAILIHSITLLSASLFLAKVKE